MRVDYGGYGRIAALFVAASLILGWGAAVRAQSAANAPEAHAFTPPPRSIADITAILDREKPDPAKIAEAKQRAEMCIRDRRDGEELVLEISDDGKPFDPTQAPPPKLNAALEERRIGGLGVYLVRTMMDEIAYRRSDGRNHLVMRKRLV